MSALLHFLVRIMPDDAYYYLQLASGRTGWGETNGYHPLWAATLWALGQFAHGDALVVVAVAAYFAVLLACPFVWWWLYRTRWAFAAWAVPTAWNGSVGMEWAVAAMLVGIWWHYRTAWWAQAAMVYARLDMGAFAAAFEAPRRWWRLALIALPWALWLWIGFGSLIPDAAMHGRRSVNFSLDLLLPLGFLWLPAMGYAVLQDRDAPMRWFAVATAVRMLVDVAMGTVWPWHYVMVPLLLMLVGRQLAESGFRRRLMALGAAGGIIALAWTLGTGYPWQRTMLDAARMEWPVPIGSYNSGILGYFNARKVYNLDGVFNHEADGQAVSYVLDWDSYVPEGWCGVKSLSYYTGMGTYRLYVRC